LLGESIEVPLRQNFQHLVVDKLTYHNVGPFSLTELWIRAPVAPALTGRINEVLRETAKEILRRVYDQPDPDAYSAILAESDREQLQVAVAQNLILDSIVLYLRQLGLRPHGELADVMQEWDRARRDLAQVDYAERQGIDLATTRREAQNRQQTAKES